MTAIAFIAGIIAARWLGKPLAAFGRFVVFVVSIVVAYRLAALAVPEVAAAINWRGFWSGAGIGLLIAFAVGATWFYLLGWRARVAATEADDIDRARQKAIKDRNLT